MLINSKLTFGNAHAHLLPFAEEDDHEEAVMFVLKSVYNHCNCYDNYSKNHINLRNRSGKIKSCWIFENVFNALQRLDKSKFLVQIANEIHVDENYKILKNHLNLKEMSTQFTSQLS